MGSGLDARRTVPVPVAADCVSGGCARGSGTPGAVGAALGVAAPASGQRAAISGRAGVSGVGAAMVGAVVAAAVLGAAVAAGDSVAGGGVVAGAAEGDGEAAGGAAGGVVRSPERDPGVPLLAPEARTDGVAVASGAALFREGCWSSGRGLGGGVAPTAAKPARRPTACCSLSSQVVAMLSPTTVDIAIAAPEKRRVGSRKRPPNGFGRLCRPCRVGCSPRWGSAVVTFRRTTGVPSSPVLAAFCHGHADLSAKDGGGTRCLRPRGQGHESTSGGGDPGRPCEKPAKVWMMLRCTTVDGPSDKAAPACEALMQPPCNPCPVVVS